MSKKLKNLFHFLSAKLSRKIVFWVFVNIVLIEAILLIPSVYRRERELLNYRQDFLSAKTEGLLMSSSADLTDADRLARLRLLLKDPKILGGAFYSANGERIGSFGDSPNVELAETKSIPQGSLLISRESTYTSKVILPEAEGRYQLILRQDAAPIKRELLAFIGRIALLVLIISTFVTIATLVVLEPLLITPILLLRQDLLNAGRAVRENECLSLFQANAYMRRDELGEVIAAFQQMFQQIKDAIAERNEAEKNARASS